VLKKMNERRRGMVSQMLLQCARGLRSSRRAVPHGAQNCRPLDRSRCYLSFAR
jgi:hypothetical protein